MADAGTDALRNFHQQAVARGMPETVVYQLEPIEVQKQYRHLELVTVCTGQCLCEPVGEQRAVCQTCQRV